MLYICIFFLLLFSCFIKSPLDKKYLYCSFLCVLILIAGFRDSSVGVDTAIGYKTYFDYISRGISMPYVEQGWIKLNQLCILLGIGYEGVIFFSFLLCIIPVLIAVRIEKTNILESLFIYYAMYLYLHAFNMIRQCIAMSFCMLALSLLLKKKYLNFLLSLFVAFMFHKSSVIFIISLPFLCIRLTRNRIIFFILISFLIGGFFSQKLFIMIAGPYAGYLQNSEFGFRPTSIVIKVFTLLLDCLFLFFILIERKQYLNEVWLKILLLGYLCMNCTMGLVLGTRLMFYFTQAQVFFYPKYFEKKQKDRLSLRIIFYSYLFINFMRILLGQWSSLVPYNNILWRFL